MLVDCRDSAMNDDRLSTIDRAGKRQKIQLYNTLSVMIEYGNPTSQIVNYLSGAARSTRWC